MGTQFVNMNMTFNIQAQTMEFLPSETAYPNGLFIRDVNDIVLYVYCFGAENVGPYGPGPTETLGPGGGNWTGEKYQSNT
jgi:hypothetical protein